MNDSNSDSVSLVTDWVAVPVKESEPGSSNTVSIDGRPWAVVKREDALPEGERLLVYERGRGGPHGVATGRFMLFFESGELAAARAVVAAADGFSSANLSAHVPDCLIVEGVRGRPLEHDRLDEIEQLPGIAKCIPEIVHIRHSK